MIRLNIHPVIEQKKTNMVKVLTKKNKSWWTEKPMYYSTFYKEKQHVYSFLNDHAANKCIDFLKAYRNFHKVYPDINGTKENLHSNFDISQQEEYLPGLKHTCLLNNVGLLGVTHFEYSFPDNSFNVEIHTVDLLQYEVLEDYDYIDNLDYLLMYP